MAINFPDSPNNGDTFTASDKTWVYLDGKWTLPSVDADGLVTSISSAASGQFLKWNGSAWVNDAIDLGTDTTGSYVSSLVAGTGVTLTNNSGEGATPTVAIGQAVATNSNVTFNDLTVSGNLTVSGTTTSINTETLTIDDNLIVLNNNATGSPTENAGIEIERGTSDNVLIRWNETNDKWEFTNDGTTYGNIAALGTIALGADTTGNYVSDISSGTGISVTHIPSEGSTGTVAIDTAVVPQLASANTFTTNQIISGSTSTALLRIIQTGIGNAFAVTDSTGGDGLFINANGGLRTNNRSAEWRAWSNTASFSAPFYFDRSRGAIYDVHSAVQSGDDIGSSVFRGSDGTAFRSAATIASSVDGAVSSNIVPGRLIFSTANTSGTLTERMRIDSAGAVGIGTTTLTGRNLRVGKALTGSTVGISVYANHAINSDVTSSAAIFQSQPSTQAASFTLSQLLHFAIAGLATPGAGSTVTTQIGFYVDSNLTGATNNYAFYGDVAAATGRYNLHMGGTADNYLAGSLGIGGTPAAGRTLTLAKPMTGAVSSFAVLASYQVASDVISTAESFRSNPNTAAASFTLANLIHFRATQATIGAGSAVTTQYGFWADSTMTGATTNIGYFGNLAASAATRFNLYMDGTAPNYLLGRVGIGTTSSSGPMLLVQNTNASDGVVTIRGAASQTGDLIAVNNSAGTKLWHINSSNSIGHGVTTATTTGFIADAGLVAKTSTAFGPQYVLGNKTNDANAGYVIIEKDRAGAIVASGDVLGNIQFRGYDGANYRASAAIEARVDGTPGTDDMPGHLRFSTTADGASTPTERMRIDSTGMVGIGTPPTANVRLSIAGPSTNSANPALFINGVSGSGALFFFNDAGAGSYNNITAAGSKAIIATGANSTTSRASLVIAPWSDLSYGIRFEGGATTNIRQWGTTIFQPSGTTSIPAIVRGLASQTANLQEWQNSSGTVLAYVAADGSSSFGNAADSDQAILATIIFV